MALVLLNTSGNPLGEFDALDSIVTSVKGGEVMMFTTVAVGSSTDKSAADTSDGYDYPGTSRTVLTTTLTSNRGPLMLCDDGTANYGTLFGTVVGGSVGQVTSGAVLGPHTATGSGKLTAWITPGLYGVTLDACDPATDTGLQPSNGSLTAGKPLYATAAGLLTPDATKSFQANRVVGYFAEFRTKGSLVTTPNKLVQALNSPTGAAGALAAGLYMAVFNWSPNNGT